MNVQEKFIAVNIQEYISNNNVEDAGESELSYWLSYFSCPINPELEKFLKKNAVEFSKKRQSITYLVFSLSNGYLVGYFTLAIKPITVTETNYELNNKRRLSNRTKNKIKRISNVNETLGTYTMSAYLIAQMGKNYTEKRNEEISGKELFQIAKETIMKCQYIVGGIALFVEAKDTPKLNEFYISNGFYAFDRRQTKSDCPYELVQYLKLI